MGENRTWGSWLRCTCCELWLEKKKNQPCRTGGCVTVINCGEKQARDILGTEEMKWKVVLSLVGWNGKELCLLGGS